MQAELKEKFLERWTKYFNQAELPVTFYYSDNDHGVDAARSRGRSCLIFDLMPVRKGNSLYFDKDTITCSGAKRYTGFSDKLRPNFEYFLSCGIPDEMEGERYIQTPEMVLEFMKNQKKLPINRKNLIFKRWDKLNEDDDPDVVIFFAQPDVLAGLFTLANFDQTEPNGTFTPFGSGCSSIIQYPYLEKDASRPRAVIGMFDPSARICVTPNIMTFAVPMIKFARMVDYMDESFLITETWKKIHKRLI
jgi:uncharacterized protein (DUF169 family)